MLETIATDGGLLFFRSALLAAAGVPHAFSTRKGGISPSPFDSLNLGNPAGAIQDDWNNIHENYRRLQLAIGCENRARSWVHQVHGGEIAIVRGDDPFESGAKADALVGDDCKKLLAVRVADCVPILMASRDGRVVAAVHAGWRGVVAGVAPAAIAAMQKFGVDAKNILVAIGPSIGVDAFEVGEEVAEAFASFRDDRVVIRPAGENPHVDLRRAIGLQLHANAIEASQVEVSEMCTASRPDLFFSHRRDGPATGRMCAMIGPRTQALH